MNYLFPFGEKAVRLEQKDRTPKKVFVLGVYPSAVHARWVNNGKIVCQALAVASEPYIFWDGNNDEAKRVISRISIPSELGELVLPNGNLNGPSGKVLDEHILNILGVSRGDAWLCDLLPEPRLNPNQLKVVSEKYNPLVEKFGLSKVTIPPVPKKYCDDVRRCEITKEIIESTAEMVVLLGDLPIKEYLSKVSSVKFGSLREFTVDYGYGRPIEVDLAGRRLEILPLAHPRQIGRLGLSNPFWSQEHKKWEGNY